MRLSFSTCSYSEIETKKDTNPNPSNFTITKTERVGNYLIVMIKYHDCTNYEGMKILVFDGDVAENLHKVKRIDPHFCDGDHISPIARFVPTEKGWLMAKTLLATLF